MIEFEPFKNRSRRTLLILSAVLTILVALWHKQWALWFGLGTVLGYGYYVSLFLAVMTTKSRLAAGVFLLRTAVVAILIVVLGQFTLWKIGLVLLGFLSYKVVLLVEILRAWIGFNSDCGKRSSNTLDD